MLLATNRVMLEFGDLLFQRRDTAHQLGEDLCSNRSTEVNIAVDLYITIELACEFASYAIDADAAVRATR